MKKLSKKQFFIVSTDTFDCDIAVFINYSYQEALKIKGIRFVELKELLKDALDLEDNITDQTEIKGRMIPMKKGYAVFLKFYKDSFRLNIKLALHEFSHVVSWMLMDRRIPLSKDTDEVYAYVIEDLFGKFLYKLY
jgi:hypothetical protein